MSDMSDMLRCCDTVRAGRMTSLTCYVAVVLSGRGGVTSLACYVAVLLSVRSGVISLTCHVAVVLSERGE